jgi:small GTP-binding protein
MKTDKQMVEAKEFDFLFKVLLVGDSGVGKSCLRKNIVGDDFVTEYNPTVGVEFGSYILNVCNLTIKLQIWDTDGSRAFRSVNRLFYRNAKCVLFAYDMTKLSTFPSVTSFLQDVR